MSIPQQKKPWYQNKWVQAAGGAGALAGGALLAAKLSGKLDSSTLANAKPPELAAPSPRFTESLAQYDKVAPTIGESASRFVNTDPYASLTSLQREGINADGKVDQAALAGLGAQGAGKLLSWAKPTSALAGGMGAFGKGLGKAVAPLNIATSGIVGYNNFNTPLMNSAMDEALPRFENAHEITNTINGVGNAALNLMGPPGMVASMVNTHGIQPAIRNGLEKWQAKIDTADRNSEMASLAHRAILAAQNDDEIRQVMMREPQLYSNTFFDNLPKARQMIMQNYGRILRQPRN